MVNNNSTNNGVMAGEIKGPVTFNISNNTSKVPLLITKLIEALADLDEEEIEETYRVTKDAFKTYDINKKIGYNNLIKYKHILEEDSKYYSTCEVAFNILDDNNIGSKKKILQNINRLYKKYKGDLMLHHREKNVGEIEIIREYADNIIDYVTQQLNEQIINGFQNENIFLEDIENGLSIIVCYGFIECKILEKPR